MIVINVVIGGFSGVHLRYHGRWIFKKNAKNLFFAVQIGKTEKNNLHKEWRKKLFLLFTIKRKTIFESH